MSDVIPFACGIGILGAFTIYQVYLSNTYVGNYRDKVYYYYSHLITLIPIVAYIYSTLNALILELKFNILIFYIDWTFTTPLILINIGRLLDIPLPQYVFLTLCDVAMITCGYVSYIVQDQLISYIFFAIGCILFCSLYTVLLRKLNVFQKKQKHSLPPTSIYRDRVRYRIFRAIVGTIVTSWTLYPIGHILAKQGILSNTHIVIWFVTLDVVSKGIFTNLLLGSREIYRQPTSLLGAFTKKVFRIHPLEHTMSDGSLEIVRAASQPAKPAQPVHPQNPELPTHPLNTPEKRVAHVESVGICSSQKTTSVYEPSMASIVEETLD